MNSIQFLDWLEESLEGFNKENPDTVICLEDVSGVEAVTLEIDLPKILTSLLHNPTISKDMKKNFVEECIISSMMDSKEFFLAAFIAKLMKGGVK